MTHVGARPGRPSLYFLLVRRVPPVPSPVLVEVFEILERQRFEVHSGIPEEMLLSADRLEVSHDLYVLKSHTELTLSLAGALHALGAQTLNPYPNCAAAQDKIVASRLLRAAGIPTPRSWTTAAPSLLRQLLSRGPLIVKPHRGHRGVGIRVLRREEDIASLPVHESPVLVQEFVEGTGEDLKVYVVGDRVFAVRKPFSKDSFTRPGRPVEPGDDVREIALRCGRAFGLGLFGLDVIESSRGPLVIDVNYFPGYKGIDGVAPLIADYIAAFATGDVTLPFVSSAGRAAAGVAP
jgi:ribosomal protein S6--L-glutamate ligase